MYKANDSIYKRRTREILYSKVVSVVKGANKKFLSLSNTTFEIETKLLEKYKNSVFFCYEIDGEIYNKALKTAPEKVVLINDDVKNFSQYNPSVNTKYSFVWLDFCASYTESIINTIVEIINEIEFEDDAVFAITLNTKRGKSASNLYFNKYYPNYKEVGIVRHITPFIKGNVVEVEKLKYTCKDLCPTGATMNLFVFTIKNQQK